MKAIYLDKTIGEPEIAYRYALWADVPGAFQPAYRNPVAVSAFRGATLAELDALRSGSVAERVGTVKFNAGTALATMDVYLQARLTEWQNDVTAGDKWPNYGRVYNGAAWTAGSTPPDDVRVSLNILPTFSALTGVSGFAANKFHFVIFNNSSFYVVRLQFLIHKPHSTTVTGALPSEFVLRRRLAPTTPPGGGLVTAVGSDNQDSLPAAITIHSAPTTSPAGGTLQDLLTFIPQPDEIKLTTLDSPTFASLQPFSGAAIYDANKFSPAIPLLIRPQQTLEVQQGTTAGTGNCRYFAVFTLQDLRVGYGT